MSHGGWMPLPSDSKGILTPDFGIDEPWPRLQLGHALSAIATETLAGTPDCSASAVLHNGLPAHCLDRRSPPFVAFRSSFQSATFLWGVRDRLRRRSRGVDCREQGESACHYLRLLIRYIRFLLVGEVVGMTADTLTLLGCREAVDLDAQ